MIRLFTILSIILSIECESQLSIHGGVTTFLGDLGGNRGVGTDGLKDINWQASGWQAGLRFRMNDFIIGSNLLTLNGSDRLIKREGGAEVWRADRSLSFRSTIIECYAGFEPDLIGIRPLAAVLLIYHKPSPRFVERNYALLQPGLMFGVGYQYKSIGLGITRRVLNTDYLDDVKVRGNSERNDSYFSITLNWEFIKSPYYKLKCNQPL